MRHRRWKRRKNDAEEEKPITIPRKGNTCSKSKRSGRENGQERDREKKEGEQRRVEQEAKEYRGKRGDIIDQWKKACDQLRKHHKDR